MTVRAFPKGGRPPQDTSPEPSAARLSQLSDDVSRIAATLAQLSLRSEPFQEQDPGTTDKAPDVSLDLVRRIIRARRLRARYFDEKLFADPVWEMLLDLLQAELAQHRVSVSSLCSAAGVPTTTALRWIAGMTSAGLVQRRTDLHDRRRVFVELSPSASRSMRRYFKAVGEAFEV
jgi:DNA-binding MarR family transcriptional regulator